MEAENMKARMRQMVAALPTLLALNEEDVRRERFVRRYLREGYLYDAALARSLEEVSGVTGFLAAIQEAWARTARCASYDLAEERCEASVLEAVLQYQEDMEPDCGGGYREDILAAYIQQHVKEVHGAYNTGRLGKLLSKHGVGHVRSCWVDDDCGRIGGQRHKECVLYLEDGDLEQMRMAIARMENPE